MGTLELPGLLDWVDLRDPHPPLSDRLGITRVSVYHTFFGLVFGWLLFHFLGPLGLHNGPKIYEKSTQIPLQEPC